MVYTKKVVSLLFFAILCISLLSLFCIVPAHTHQSEMPGMASSVPDFGSMYLEMHSNFTDQLKNLSEFNKGFSLFFVITTSIAISGYINFLAGLRFYFKRLTEQILPCERKKLRWLSFFEKRSEYSFNIA